MGIFLSRRETNTVKWTVPQYHAKVIELHPRPASHDLLKIACLALGTSSGSKLARLALQRTFHNPLIGVMENELGQDLPT